MYKSTTPPHHLNLCKTVLYVLICLSLTFSLTSCGNLNSPKMPTQTGNFTFKISDEVIARIKNAVGHSRTADASRSAVAPDINIEIHLDKTSGGQLVDTVKVSGTLEELTGRVIKIRSVPLNTPFIVSMVIKVDNKEILTGTSDTITLTSTDPTAVTISLKLSDSLSSIETEQAALWGTWVFDYGYNQDLWADDLITFNIDGTFDTHLVAPYYREWDKGTYSVAYDNLHNMILTLNITEYSDDCATWHDVNVTNYYYLDYDSDELVMNRFKRDRVQEDGWHPVEYYEPAIYNHYYRVKNGTKDLLIQDSWTVDKVRTQGCDWDETWTFHADGTMTSDWSDNGTEILTGTYDLKEKDGKTILHQQLSFNDGTTGEWWYEYSSCGPDLIRVALINSSSGGELDEPYVNYYYRDVPLVKYTYHWKVSDGIEYTFYDYWPKSEEYKLLDLSKRAYISGLPDEYLNQELKGWYASEDFSGSKCSKITAANNTTDREFWAGWTIKTTKAGWVDDQGNEGQHYVTSLPAKGFIQNVSIPRKGDTMYILVQANLSKDIDGMGCFGIIDSSPDHWYQYDDWNYFKTENKQFNHVFQVKIDDDFKARDISEMGFIFYYSNDDYPVTLENYSIIQLNDRNSFILNYHVGDLTFTTRALTEEDFELPTKDGLWDVFYPYYSDYEYYATNYIDFEGWADDTGTPVPTVTGNVGETKDVYMNFTPSFGMWGERNTNDYGFDFCLPVRTLISDDDELETLEAISSSNPITIQMNATIPEGTTISNVNDHWHAFIIDTSEGSDWGDIGEDYSCVVQDGNNLTAVFTLQPDQGRHIPTLDDMEFHIDYHHEFFDEPLEFSNFEIHVLGSDNWYNLVYHFGNMTYTEKAYRLADRALPTDMQYFSECEDFDAEIAYNLNMDKWYGNADITGYPITAVASESVEPGMESHVYMNITPKMSQGEPDENDDYAWFTYLPAQVFFTNDDLSDLSGMTEENAVTVKMKSEMSSSTQESINQDEYCGLYLVDRSQDNWERVAFGSLRTNCCEYGLWEGEFSLTLLEGKSLPENIEDMLICFEYNKRLYDGDMESNCFSLWIEH